MDQLECSICRAMIPGGLCGLSKHFTQEHSLTLKHGLGGDGFVLGQNGCLRNFKYFSNLRRHIKASHLAAAANVSPPRDVNVIHNTEEEINNKVEVDVLQEHENMSDEYEEDEFLADQEIQDDELDLRLLIVRMIGELQSNGFITGAILTLILENHEEVFLRHQNDLKKKFMDRLQIGEMIDAELVNDVERIMNFKNPFEGLKSYDQQIKAMVEHFGYIEQIEIPLGCRTDVRLDKSTCTFVPQQVMDSFQYVPVIKVLEMVLRNPNVRKAINDEKASSEGILGSFINGQCFKKRPFFQKYRHALRIKLYYDELEIVNPLGSKIGVHKLGCFYFQISNLPPHMNSQLHSIHVLLTFCYVDVSTYSFDRLLEPFMNDLAKLESDEGITLNFGDENYILRATIEGFCGDGLAVHQVFNLLGPSANYFCRLCLYSRDDLHRGSLETGTERTKEVFDQHVAHLQNHNFSKQIMIDTGVRGECSLNKSRYFHISQNKIFDVMHDFLCEICPMVVKLVLNYFICTAKLFDTQYLNGIIAMFNYGYAEYKNKPSANFTNTLLQHKDHKLPQKAMQIWCLTRSLLFLLKNKVDSEEEHLELIFYLLRIMEVVFASKVHVSSLGYLDVLIRDFRMCFQRLFPQVNEINKMHHLSHYAECITWSGLLLQFYCMRFESKHYEIKLRAQNVQNFKNPPKTLIRISQCVQCCKWGNGDVKINSFKVKNGKTFKVHGLQSKQYLLDLNYVQDNMVFSATSVFNNGVEFQKGLFVILETIRTSSNSLPLYARIEEIIVLQDKCFLLVSICKTLFFNNRLHAYCIETENTDWGIPKRFIDVSTLPLNNIFSHWTESLSDGSVHLSHRHIIL